MLKLLKKAVELNENIMDALVQEHRLVVALKKSLAQVLGEG